MLVPSVFLIAVLLGLVSSKRSIVFKGKHTVTREIPDANFKSFFARKETPIEILNLNPGLERIEQSEHDNSVYTGYLTGVQFPGILNLF